MFGTCSCVNMKSIFFILFFIVGSFSVNSFASHVNEDRLSSLQKFNINIIAPASGKVNKATIQSMLKKFGSLGFEIDMPKDLLKETLFCSNTDEYRANHLIKSLKDEQQKIIWALRGGYGSMRIISKLYDLEKPSKEKIFIGYSDITVLHLFLSQKWGWYTIHGSVAKEITEKLDPKNLEILLGLIKTEGYEVKIPIDFQLNKIKFSNLKGKLSGGNLAIIQNSIGTKWELESKDKIIFLEDINEEGYKVDRMLEHLKQSGVLKGAKAIIFGDFLEKEGANSTVNDALIRFANSVDIPVFKTKYFGHGYHNYPLVYNASANILTKDGGLLLTYDMKKS